MSIANLPWIESPFFEEILKTKKLTDQQLQYIPEYQKTDLLLSPVLLPQSLIDRTKEDAENKGFNPDFPIKPNGMKEGFRICGWFLKHPKNWPAILHCLKYWKFFTDGSQFLFRH
jgi:hypothetical protein